MSVFIREVTDDTRASRLREIPLFFEVARAIDDGWSRIENTDVHLSSIELSPTIPESPQQLGDRLYADPKMDLAELMSSQRAAEVAQADHRTLEQTIRAARARAGVLANSWITNHEEEIVHRVAEERERIATAISVPLGALGPLLTPDDLQHHPEVAHAYAEAGTLVAEWETWTSLHRAVIDDAPDIYDSASSRWPGIDWVLNIDEQWPDFYMVHPFSLDLGYAVPGSYGERPPWGGETLLEKARALATYRSWAPTRAQVRAERERLDRLEHALRARAQDDAVARTQRGINRGSKPGFRS